MDEQMERRVGSRSLREWLAEGEELYARAMQEYQTLQGQIAELEERLEAKREEINQVAQVIGKPPVEPQTASTNSGTPVQIIDRDAPGSVPMSRNTIAKALTGRGLG